MSWHGAKIDLKAKSLVYGMSPSRYRDLALSLTIRTYLATLAIFSFQPSIVNHCFFWLGRGEVVYQFHSSNRIEGETNRIVY